MTLAARWYSLIEASRRLLNWIMSSWAMFDCPVDPFTLFEFQCMDHLKKSLACLVPLLVRLEGKGERSMISSCPSWQRIPSSFCEACFGIAPNLVLPYPWCLPSWWHYCLREMVSVLTLGSTAEVWGSSEPPWIWLQLFSHGRSGFSPCCLWPYRRPQG